LLTFLQAKIDDKNFSFAKIRNQFGVSLKKSLERRSALSDMLT
jgi:hypothetical protein